ncbi:hypothetical protein [Nonomuraea guangzhouensis]|uniref:Rhomboid family intramembrane serine protease n=1 Tax=Nonomuraea guangzhouensis TaxID=1291555 RepID=A0ABW4GW48_9ACTN|nr:hypothetical protein [Nonomuraea guangzhouensis]
MSELLFSATTAALMVMMINSGLALGPARGRPIPWVAVGLTALAICGVVIQLAWSGAMDALDNDPAKTGWWRVLTSVFMQNGGVAGAVWNIATLAIVAALAQWFWGGPLTVALFAGGIFLPEWVDALLGMGGPSTDPRNFAGSSGATYFLGATLATALVMRTRLLKERLLAVSVPLLGLAMWFAQSNGHGLVTAYGFITGFLAWVAWRAIETRRESAHRR